METHYMGTLVRGNTVLQSMRGNVLVNILIS